MSGLGAHYELEVRCVGTPDPITGYLMNIREIDEAVRQQAIPIIQAAFQSRQAAAPALLLPQVIQALQAPLGGTVVDLRWWLTPYHFLSMRATATDRVLLSQQFEFAASHRLHSPQLADDANRRIFGKCNSAHGHGHNYRLQTTVSIPVADSRKQRFDLQTLEQIVDQTVIQRFDHKHLNLDTAEFADVNPSVEQMARVCYELLADPLERAGARLEQVTLWETEKTSCTYPAHPSP